MTVAASKDAIRDAATVILIRRDTGDPRAAPRVLMGQRGGTAAFMPSKFVFPGGAVDPGDFALAGMLARTGSLPDVSEELMAHPTDPALAASLALAAVRELWEETGLALACKETDACAPEDPPKEWRAFFAAGFRPALDRLDFIMRAVTPPGRPRRFDARFFLAKAEVVQGDLEDFSRASGELSRLRWLTLPEARQLDLPFITGVALAEVEARLASSEPRPALFFRRSGEKSCAGRKAP